MSLMKENGQEIYVRYLTAASGPELRGTLLASSRVPHKFDIGAVYNQTVESKGDLLGESLLPLQRELVVDIDMNDYDEIRTCCQGKKVCPSCWLFIAVAAKVLHNALTKHFGYHSLLYVFSGRRGLHIWASDDTAKSLQNSTRSALIAYLTIFNNSNLPGRLDQSQYQMETLTIIKQYWTRVLRSQDFFYKSERARQ
ncbi:DNA primase, partial [Gregarina niphandrodes]